MELIRNEQFVAATLNPENGIFVVHVIVFISSSSDVYFLWQAKIVLLKADEAPITVLNKFADFANVFLPDLAIKLLEYIGINNYIINVIDSKQSPYGPIYSLRLVESKILNTYIDINLANNFMRFFKSPTVVLILFVRKLEDSLRLCVNY